MKHNYSILIHTLSVNELDLYKPENRYWVLRNLWRTKPSSSVGMDRDNKPNLVVIRIEFHNESDGPIELSFHNTACKAEFLSLEVHDENGARIQPVGGVHIKLAPDPCPPHVVPIHGKYVYDLVGEVDDDWLVFPGAKYSIPQNRSLQITFKYEGSTSNLMQLHL